jgi:hypothetical protein
VVDNFKKFCKDENKHNTSKHCCGSRSISGRIRIRTSLVGPGFGTGWQAPNINICTVFLGLKSWTEFTVRRTGFGSVQFEKSDQDPDKNRPNAQLGF